MPIPPEMMKKLLQDMAENMKREMGRAERRMLDCVEGFGIRLTPCGSATLAGIVSGMAEHVMIHTKGQPVSTEFALQCVDEFMAMWAIQRLEEDPDWLDKARKATVDQISGMFQGEIPDLKVIS